MNVPSDEYLRSNEESIELSTFQEVADEFSGLQEDDEVQLDEDLPDTAENVPNETHLVEPQVISEPDAAPQQLFGGQLSQRRPVAIQIAPEEVRNGDPTARSRRTTRQSRLGQGLRMRKCTKCGRESCNGKFNSRPCT